MRRVILDEPEALNQELDKIWARIEEAHERSEVGNLVRPADLYLTPEDWREKIGSCLDRRFRISRAELGNMGWAPGTRKTCEAAFLSQPATRFHGAVPAHD